MKPQGYKGHRDITFDVGDMLLVKLQRYHQHSSMKCKSYKLDHIYYGSYVILSRIGNVTYALELPLTACIHDVFQDPFSKKFMKDLIQSLLLY